MRGESRVVARRIDDFEVARRVGNRQLEFCGLRGADDAFAVADLDPSFGQFYDLHFRIQRRRLVQLDGSGTGGL